MSNDNNVWEEIIEKSLNELIKENEINIKDVSSKIKKIIFEELDKTIHINITKKIDIIVEEYTKEILWKIHKK